MKNALKKLTHAYYRFFKAKPSGLLPLRPDARDYTTDQLGGFWGLGYTPKHSSRVIPTESVKNQLDLQTCQWNATAVQKEVDEKQKLSVRSLVIKGKEMGLVGDLGLSDLRSGQKVLQSWGILPEDHCPDTNKNDWELYTAFDVNRFSDVAAQHKIKSYWFVKTLNDVYRLLDEGRVLTTGMRWYTGFNQGGGFKLPWIIEAVAGWAVGGHAFVVIGYDTNFNGKRVLVMQNSYGENWGSMGNFYITEDYFVRECLNRYGCVVHLDDEAVKESWVDAGKQIFERVKKDYTFIIRSESAGEMYEITDTEIKYVPIVIGSEKMRKELNEYLRQNKRFIGVSEENFDLLTKYARLIGLKVGTTKETK